MLKFLIAAAMISGAASAQLRSQVASINIRRRSLYSNLAASRGASPPSAGNQNPTWPCSPIPLPATPTRDMTSFYKATQMLKLDASQIVPIHGKPIPWSDFAKLFPQQPRQTASAGN